MYLPFTFTLLLEVTAISFSYDSFEGRGSKFPPIVKPSCFCAFVFALFCAYNIFLEENFCFLV